MQTCVQYNVELRQNCTKTVDLTTVGKMDNLRTYQKMFLMTQKEIDYLYDRFKECDTGKTYSLSPIDLKNNLTVFGYNYPPENLHGMSKKEKDDMQVFIKLWDAEVEKINIDEDTDHISFDEFLLLFVRQQSNLHWNRYLPRYYGAKKKLPF